VGDAPGLARRLLALHEVVGHLETHLADLDTRRLTVDPVLEAAVERWVQIAVESCIDIAYHIVAERGWTPPDAARAAFTTLAAHGMISVELAERLGRAAGLRNILVHEYVRVDITLLIAAVHSGLPDLRAFAAHAAAWLPASPA
jgi:uncharacterized protein YutE (UPF0331/DUF86 family)